VRNFGVIYTITSLISGKQYLGSARDFNKRSKQHLRCLKKGNHHSRYLQRAWNKYGEQNFMLSPVLVCREQDLFFYEQCMLDAFRPAYNVNPSAQGSRGLKWTKTQRNKITGRVNSFATRQAISRGMLENTTPEKRRALGRLGRAGWTEASKQSQIAKLTGRKDSSETIAKKVAKLIGHTVSPETREKLRAQHGWKHSEEAKAKMRGRMRTAEHRRKLGLAAIGRKLSLGRKVSEETRALISLKLKGRKRSLEAIAKHRQTNAMKRLASIDHEVI
jgi:group I intron endonuclease